MHPRLSHLGVNVRQVRSLLKKLDPWSGAAQAARFLWDRNGFTGWLAPCRYLFQRTAGNPVLLFAGFALFVLPAAAGDLRVEPGRFELRGKAASQQLIVFGEVEGRTIDLTRDVGFRSLTPNVLRVTSAGVVTAIGNGEGAVAIDYGGQEVHVAAAVKDAEHHLPVSFELDVQPILTARGCNAGACHGKARGQNGFQLSLLGFDPDFDYQALTRNARGRRVFPAAPERSLLLQKAAAAVPHGGGRRLAEDGSDYSTLRRWIEAGMPRRLVEEPELVAVRVTPEERSMRPGEQQQLIVTAEYSDGRQRDVTGQSNFASSEDAVAAINGEALVKAGPIAGEATTMARFMGRIATCRVVIPLEGNVPADVYANLPRNNFIDELVWQKLETLGVTPSEPVGDAKYMRRVSIDLIGRLPAPDEVRAFLADSNPEKRRALVDSLLQRPEYANHWANKWVDLLRPNPFRVGFKAVLNYDNWIRESFRRNKPYDQFVRELITARGTTWHNGATTLFRDRRTPEEVTTLVSQLFLGIRLECAKCHQHPFEKWGQEHFYQFAAYFARVGHRGRLSPPISGDLEKIFTAPASKNSVVRHPLSGDVLEPLPLFGEAPSIDSGDDPRDALALWMTSDENDFFAQVIVNRIWADLMGRGLVEPVDDLRATNPPTNGPLLAALAAEFRRQKFDIKSLLRTITASHVYALGSESNQRNAVDTQNYSRHYRQRLRAEVLLDAISDITGLPDTFAAMPQGSRANEIWTHRIGSIFLDTFGRPDANQDPPCERTGETTATQALHLMNSPQLHAKVTSDEGRAAKLAAGEATNEKIVEELYLLVYGRLPDEREQEIGRNVFENSGRTRRQAAEDLLWALINTAEFVFKD